MFYIQHATLLTPRQRLDDSAVLVDGGRIQAVDTTARLPCPPGTPRLDATGLILAPGFIDLQLNGAFGFDFTAEPQTIFEVAARLPQYGVTSFLPTLITSPLERVAAAQALLCSGPPAHVEGAVPLGLHLEGPFLNPAKRGAHNPAYLRLPDNQAAAGWGRETGVWLVTLAPELPGAIDLIQSLVKRDVVVSAGHSMATIKEAQAGFDVGMTYGTHLFNAMPALDHRAPGLAGALLTEARATIGLIPDGIHLHPTLVKLIWQAKDPDQINVVSDAMAALGMPAGQYRLGDFDVVVDDTSARLSDGRLAGSILSLDRALRNLMTYTGCSLSQALGTLTTVPARTLGLTDRGQIAPGYRADLVLLTPELKIAQTWVGGERSYFAESFDVVQPV